MTRVLQFLCLAALAAALLVAPLCSAELAVASDDTPLLAECADASNVVAKLSEGQRVRLRFAIAGASNRCYSVAAEVDGQAVAGYVDKQALKGLEEFEQVRRDSSAQQLAAGVARSIRIHSPGAAPEPETQPVTGNQRPALEAAVLALEQSRPQDAPKLLAALPKQNRNAAVLRAQAYLQMTRPADAWAALKPVMSSQASNDPALLGLAGVASFQQDRMPQARLYLKQSLALQHNPSLEKLYRKIQVEESSDHSNEATYGSRFVLRYEGEALPQSAARSLARSFDSEILRITQRLDCPVNDRVTVIVQARDNYQRSTGAAEWSGGRYDGRIHIAVPPSGQVDEYVRSTFAHEFVHACLARKGSWPAWLHEGLAQQMSGRRLDAEERQALSQLQQTGRLPTLAQLGGGWARLGNHEAAVAYALALAAAQILHQDLQDYGLRELLNQPGRLSDVQKQLDKKLQAAFSR